MAKRSVLILLLLLGLFIIIFHEPVTELTEDIVAPKDPRPVIATLDEYEGDVNYKLPKTLVYKRVRDNMGFRDQDTVVTASDGKAIISFTSGFRLEVTPNSVVVIEQPEVGTDGAIRLTFLRGDYRVLNSGAAGSLLLSKDDMVQDPAGRAPLKEPMLVSLKPSKPEIAPPEKIKTEVIEELKKTVEKPKAEAKKPRETLPDEYIAQVIKKQTPFFNRCYAEHLRLNPNARGRINLTFTIIQSGMVSSVRLLGSTLKDPRLEQCTMSVVERARFRKFDGDPIIVNYPINFE